MSVRRSVGPSVLFFLKLSQFTAMQLHLGKQKWHVRLVVSGSCGVRELQSKEVAVCARHSG